MKRYQAVLFDLDGTLLPMDQDAFVEAYFRLLAEELAPFGFDGKELAHRIWDGTAAMVKNDGSCTNEERFWQRFGPYAQAVLPDIRTRLDAFYRGRFQKAGSQTKGNRLAVRAVEAARKRAESVVLATNPFFPVSAIETRLSWIGLRISDFDWVTTYEKSHYCKPNPDYLREILLTVGAKSEASLMVGNDVQEDMACCAALGMEHFLVRDCLLTHGLDPLPYRGGSFAQLVAFLEEEL